MGFSKLGTEWILYRPFSLKWNFKPIWDFHVNKTKWISADSLDVAINVHVRLKLRASLHDTQSELKPVWNLKPVWKVVPFTWQFTWRFHCGNFLNNNKTLLHMCKWYLLINAHARALVSNFNDSAQLYFAAGIYCLHGKLAAIWNFILVTKWNLHRSEFEPFWNAANKMKLHVNRTCFHAGLKSQTGMSSFHPLCERILSLLVFPSVKNSSLFLSPFSYQK